MKIPERPFVTIIPDNLLESRRRFPRQKSDSRGHCQVFLTTGKVQFLSIRHEQDNRGTLKAEESERGCAPIRNEVVFDDLARCNH